MHLTDIKDDLAARRISGIEDAFRALVGWPHEDTIVGSTASNRKWLLTAVCEALQGDERIVPGRLHEEIGDAAGEPVAPTYAACAAAVLRRPDAWLAQLERAG